MDSVVSRFFIRALLYFLPCLGAWFLARHWMAWLPAHLAGEALNMIFPFWLKGYSYSGTTLTLLSSIEVHQAGRVADMIFESDALVYCYGFPLLAAFLLASKAERLGRKLALGAAILIPLQVWGVCFHLLTQVAAYGGPPALWRTGFTPLQLNAFGLCYQIGYLLLPTLGPVMIWLWLERRFMVSVILDAALSGAGQAAATPKE